MEFTPGGGAKFPVRRKTDRKVAKGRRNHFTGQFTFGPDEGETMDVESNTELRVALVTLARPDVVGLEHQVPFEWVGPDGKTATHHFDFMALMADGSRRAIMVKSEYRRLQLKTQLELAQVASQVTPDFADEVVVMTERDIDPVEYFNAEIMHEMRRADFEADAAVRSGNPRLRVRRGGFQAAGRSARQPGFQDRSAQTALLRYDPDR
ncbi:hypothetical protein SAMN05444414_106162 [Roseovarius marisflavi]|uniref:TnsA endonuclease N terminal n=1 Tax=Roseovarius marisflavi TaxID=1054996 RepID=A0A1M6YGK0_9RHOB|nr:hypothetical protein [Roseovarius marisflavi]SHL17119.1 hypothetical protein SAMN05444414_106162 [Roseovarius marisflavi]